MKIEQWRPVICHEDRYEISSWGNIRNKITGRTLRAGLNSDGYRQTTILRTDGSKRTVKIHVLVLESFVGLRPLGDFGCHNDGHKLNNMLENLRWDSPFGNAQDRIKHGASRSKLTDEMIMEICASPLGCRRLATIYPVHRVYIAKLRREAKERAAV